MFTHSFVEHKYIVTDYAECPISRNATFFFKFYPCEGEEQEVSVIYLQGYFAENQLFINFQLSTRKDKKNCVKVFV